MGWPDPSTRPLSLRGCRMPTALTQRVDNLFPAFARLPCRCMTGGPARAIGSVPVLSHNSDGQRYAAYELTIAGDANYGAPDDADAAYASIRPTRSGAAGDRARQGTALPVPRVPPGVCAAELTRRRFRPSPSSTVGTRRLSRGSSVCSRLAHGEEPAARTSGCPRGTARESACVIATTPWTGQAPVRQVTPDRVISFCRT